MAAGTAFGIGRYRLTPLAADGTPGTALVTPGKALSVSNSSDSQTAEGDNTILETRYFNKTASGSGEVTYVDPTIAALLGGGTVTTTGTAPNTTISYAESKDINDGFLLLEARSPSGNGSVIQLSITKATTPGASIDLSTGNYSSTTFDFTANPDDDGNLWQLDQLNGTAATLTFA